MPADPIRDVAYCETLNRELVCALGCTEPIAVAYAAALASQTIWMSLVPAISSKT